MDVRTSSETVVSKSLRSMAAVHIWVLNRPRDIMPDESGPRTDCCIAAPAVVELDADGNVLRAWGGLGHDSDWPRRGIAWPGPAAEHNIVIDREGNVWISGGRLRTTSRRTFSPEGFSLLTWTRRREIYIVDAKRVLVYDYECKFKRG